jgi:hypothetical protein
MLLSSRTTSIGGIHKNDAIQFTRAFDHRMCLVDVTAYDRLWARSSHVIQKESAADPIVYSRHRWWAMGEKKVDACRDVGVWWLEEAAPFFCDNRPIEVGPPYAQRPL